jgi:hypothetical protein
MKTLKIKAQSGAKYLGDIIEFESGLPKNCLFDKGRTGCGGTTIALEDGKPYVIAAPFVQLIKNKDAQMKLKDMHICPVFEGVTVQDIRAYILLTTSSNRVPKIMTTYDGIEKVLEAIENPKDFNLLVDEYHLLLGQYNLRKSAISKLLDVYSRFGSYCFMTATPMTAEYTMSALANVPRLEVEWEDIELRKVVSIMCPKGVAPVIYELVNSFINGEKEGNAYLFVNSVAFMKDVIEACGLTFENCNLVYSENNKTILPIERGSLETPKKINMLTSTAFEGCDVYDTEGRTFVVSDPSKVNSLLDISTTFSQISGRIRDAKDKTITHYYKTTRYSEVSLSEFKAQCDALKHETKDIVKSVNQATTDSARKVLSDLWKDNANDNYIARSDDGFLKFDNDMVTHDMHNYHVANQYRTGQWSETNKNNLGHAYEKNGFDVDFRTKTATKIALTQTTSLADRLPRMEIIEAKSVTERTKDETRFLEECYYKYDFLVEAIPSLGYDYLTGTCQGKVSVIKAKITMKDDKKNAMNKLAKVISPSFSVGQFYPLSIVKSVFENAFVDLEVSNIKAKATMIGKYYEVKRAKRTLDYMIDDNGKNILSGGKKVLNTEKVKTNGYVIKARKTFFK